MTDRKKRRRKPQNNFLVLRLLLLVILVLVVFEGKLVHTMFSQRGITVEATGGSDPDIEIESVTEEDLITGEDQDQDTDMPEIPDSSTSDTGEASGPGATVLAGFGSGTSIPAPSAGTQTTTSSSEVIVSEQSAAVDDSYFSDAVFIGDSRMEGFRNTSGLTTGTFLTAVGMSIDQFERTTVNTATDGTVTIYQALSGIQYGKIYIMLGTNDLGYNPWELFKPSVESILQKIHQLQPNAVIYFCSVIYVEEAKVETSYVNNSNVDLVNGYLLEACQDLDYVHYINFNDVLDNGYGALIDGASADGIHLEANYTKMMLEYLRTHYLEGTAGDSIAFSNPATTAETTAPTTAETTAVADTGVDAAGTSDTGSADDTITIIE